MTTTNPETPDPTYTVFIRLPFPRGDFVDPPPVEWDSTKDKVLWKIISKRSRGDEPDWNVLAEKFQVTLPFLLQQAAWLYERELSKVRAQMRRVGTKGTASPLNSESTSGSQRAPSALSIRKDNAGIPAESSAAQQARPSSLSSSLMNSAPIYARPTPSISPRLQKATAYTERTTLPAVPPRQRSPSPTASPTASPSSSSSSSPPPTHSRLLRRPPRPSAKVNLPNSTASDEDNEPAFLQFSTAALPKPQDPRPTQAPHPHTHKLPTRSRTDPLILSQTSDSSSGSAPLQRPVNRDIRRLAHPLSPRGATEGGKARESDGSPSMGSSFSDLDDASITQSAMDEAGGDGARDTMARRLSNFGAFARQRYTGK